MNTREFVLQVFQALESRSSSTSFSLAEVLAEAKRSDPNRKEQTLRTYVTSVMCADAPVHHANHTNDLRRVGHGRYQRAQSPVPTTTLSSPIPEPSRQAEPPAARPETGDASDEWYWEGNIQASVIPWLASQGWSILSVADTSTRQHGIDIVAKRDGVRLGVEVKGYPSEFYARGPNQGERKPTNQASQARVWFDGLVVSSLVLRDGDEVDEVLMVVPDMTTYRTRYLKVKESLTALGIPIAFVQQNGSVHSSER